MTDWLLLYFSSLGWCHTPQPSGDPVYACFVITECELLLTNDVSSQVSSHCCAAHSPGPVPGLCAWGFGESSFILRFPPAGMWVLQNGCRWPCGYVTGSMGYLTIQYARCVYGDQGDLGVEALQVKSSRTHRAQARTLWLPGCFGQLVREVLRAILTLVSRLCWRRGLSV